MKKRFIVALAILMASVQFVQSQSLADYQFTTGNDSTRWYTVDSTTNILNVGSSRYYMRSIVLPIGFSFPFAADDYTQFSVTGDGNLRLGPVQAISSSGNQGSPFFPSRAGTNNPKINFFGCAGYVSDSAYVYKQLFGTSPNRVLVVEFALQTYTSSSRPSLMRYQVQLHENGDIQIVYPSRPPRLTPGCNRQQGMCVDETDVWIVDQNHQAAHYTAGYSLYIPSGNWPDTNRYYRFSAPVDVCPTPANLAAFIDTASVTLTWDRPIGPSAFLVEYSTTLFTPGSPSASSLVVYDTSAFIGNLNPNTQYFFCVRSLCGDTSNAAFLTATTLLRSPVSDYPYFCDFESSDERSGWYFPSHNISTHWCMGTAANNTDTGLYALYVSQDSGATNTGGDEWIGTYAWRDVNMQAGEWLISFDWRAYGDFRTNSAGTTNYYHFMRAFLVPSSVVFNSQTPPSFPASPHSTAVPSGWIELNPASHAFAGHNDWVTHQTVVNLLHSGCYHLVFYWETDGYDPETDRPAAIDNIFMERNACRQPAAISDSAYDNAILISWQPAGYESSWLVSYEGNETVVYDTFYMAVGLYVNTPYHFHVRAICSDGDTSLPISALFRTTDGGPVTSIPYSCSFEDSLEASSWITLGEGQQNQWYVGTAVNNTPQGQHALYVSNDAGVTNAYSATSRSRSYACRRILLDTSEYVCSFDWRCQGDESFHFLRAFIVPEAAIPAAGTFPINHDVHNAVPSGWIDLAPQTHYLSGQSSWTTLSHTFRVPDSGCYAILFMWENDDYTPSNPPAAVDNVAITPLTCPMPESLAATSDASSVDLAWDADSNVYHWIVEYDSLSFITYSPSFTASGLSSNTAYTFSVFAVCHNLDTSFPAILTVRTACLPLSVLPFTCDFESYPSGTGNGDDFIPCWNRIRNYSTVSPYVYSNTTDGNYLYWNITAGMLDRAFVVLPELDTNIFAAFTELRFRAMKRDIFGLFEDPVFIVGVMDDPSDSATFTPVDTIVVSSESYTQYTVPLWNYYGNGRYVTILGTVFASTNSSAMCQMDDVQLYDLPVCLSPRDLIAQTGIDTVALSWTPGGNEVSWVVSFGGTSVSTMAPEYITRGLLPDSDYSFSVVSVCASGDTSDVLTALVHTQAPPPCAMPQFLSAEVGIDSVALSWIPGGNELSWIVFGNDTAIATVTPTCVFRGLMPDSDYLFSVVSLCAYGDTSEALSAPFRTLPLPPPPPDCPPVGNLSVSIDPSNPNIVSFSWLGDAPAYQIAILAYPDSTLLLSDTVEVNHYLHDFDSTAGEWLFIVRPLCNDTLFGQWTASEPFTTIQPVGIETTFGHPVVSLSPNPSYGYSTLVLSGLQGTASVSVVDMSGAIVETYSLQSTSHGDRALLIHGLPSGTYFLRITAPGFQTVRKLVVR